MTKKPKMRDALFDMSPGDEMRFPGANGRSISAMCSQIRFFWKDREYRTASLPTEVIVWRLK